MTDLAVHLSREEMACHHCNGLIVTKELLTAWTHLRMAVGAPIKVRSGYRCPVHNKAVGGTRNSQHLYGKAIDIEYPLTKIWPGLELYEVLKTCGFHGVGRASWGWHLDVRPLEEECFWLYSADNHPIYPPNGKERIFLRKSPPPGPKKT